MRQAISTDERERERIIMLRRGMYFSLPLVTFFGVVDLIEQHILMGVIDLLTSVLLSVCLWWSYHTSRYQQLAHTVSFTALFLYIGALLDGGITGAGFVWSFGYPFIVCFIVGAWMGLVWAMAYILIGLLGLYVQHTLGTMVYTVDAVAYACSAYALFVSFAFFLSRAIELREIGLYEAGKELRASKQELEASHRRYKVFMKNFPGAMGVYQHGHWVFVNDTAVRFAGASHLQELLGKDALAFVHPDDRRNVGARLKLLEKSFVMMPPIDIRCVRLNGEEFFANIYSQTIDFEGERAVLVVAQDVTRRKQAEKEEELLRERLEQSQRLESLGVLSGGIAHDFNNILAAIVANSELIKLDLQQPELAEKHLEHVQLACQKGKSLCMQMLAYAGKGKLSKAKLDVTTIIKESCDMVRASLGRRVDLQVELPTSALFVEGDDAQIQQLLLNLIVNASEAIAEEEGIIRVRAQECCVDAAYLVNFQYQNELASLEKYPAYLSIQVQDNGKGMDAATLTRIFEPFYSTKSVGSGLGLSAIQGIVRSHNGAIRVESEIGQGTTFEVLMPLIDDKQAKSRQSQEIVYTHKTQLCHQNSKRILIIDDEEFVREALEMILQRLGYEVVCAENGQQGLELFQQEWKSLYLVLLDISMPVLNGIETMHRMRDITHDIPILLVSGYSEMEISSLDKNKRPDGFIQKPFEIDVLKNTLAKF